MTLTIPGGLLIAIDGIDGAGKTTLANALRERLEAAGTLVVQGKEPTTGEWGVKLRESAAAGRLSPEQELDYLVRDRRQHVDQVIAPALRAGAVVILDRYVPSTVAYQGAAGIPVEQLLSANEFAPVPDLLLVLDVDPEVGLDRIRSRGDKPNHFETLDNLQLCREIFLALEMPGMKVVDGGQSAGGVLEKCHVEVLLAIMRKMQGLYADPVDAIKAVRPYLAGAL